MFINTLIPTHNTLRSTKVVDEMVTELRSDFSKTNIYFAKDRIKLVRTPDGLTYIHDGHHRLVAMHIFHILKSKDSVFIPKWAYDLKEVTYEHYLELNPPIWVTPLDLRTHVRTPNFFEVKDELLKCSNNELLKSTDAFISIYGDKYLEPRLCSTIFNMYRDSK